MVYGMDVGSAEILKFNIRKVYMDALYRNIFDRLMNLSRGTNREKRIFAMRHAAAITQTVRERFSLDWINQIIDTSPDVPVHKTHPDIGAVLQTIFQEKIGAIGLEGLGK